MIRCIVSGGQTGVDRAALDAALALEFNCGGWCPKGRLAEDGVLPDRYPLIETECAEYDERTALNVRDSDGTLILTVGAPTGGTAYTVDCAEELGRPYLLIDLNVTGDASIAQEWAETYSIEVLNVAGPREITQPGIYEKAYAFMKELLTAKSDNESPLE